MYEVSNAMQTSLELNHVLYIILTGVTSHTGLGFNRAALFLLNNNERCLEVKMAIGPESGEHAKKIWNYISESNQNLDDLIKKDNIAENLNQSSLYKALKKLKIPLDNKTSGPLINTFLRSDPLHIKKNKISEYSNNPFLKIFKTDELVIVPLKAKNKTNGLIVADNLYTKKTITEANLKMFTMLANQAGLAIENSRLYEMTKHKSHTDSLTGLWNHGFFQNQLTWEIKNSKKNKHPISLIIMDIDNFKNLNDNYGHQNGDVALKEIGRLLKKSSRDLDYACRYGGEEFSLILTRTDKKQAFSIAERIRQMIKQHKFPQFSLYEKIKITVSIGVATLSTSEYDESEAKEELIARADKAMYKAKFMGKNQTHAAE